MLVSLIQGGLACVYASEVKQPKETKETINSKQEYLKTIAKRFRRNYFPLPDYCNCVAKVKFSIDAKGHPSKIQVVKSAVKGKTKKINPINDTAMIDAVKNLTDMPELPSEMSNPSQILLTLDGRAEGPMKIIAEVINEHVSSEK
jgi:hypothetical protein